MHFHNHASYTSGPVRSTKSKTLHFYASKHKQFPYHSDPVGVCSILQQDVNYLSMASVASYVQWTGTILWSGCANTVYVIQYDHTIYAATSARKAMQCICYDPHSRHV